MKTIIIFLNGDRGINVLSSVLLNEYHVAAVVVPQTFENSSLRELIKRRSIPLLSVDNVNTASQIERIRGFESDLFIVAGFPTIFRRALIDIPKIGIINLHAGRLPQYRGGSPLNWQLINGEETGWVSVIRLMEGIDTGPILAEKSFPIGARDTIAGLHKKANQIFPELVLTVLEDLEKIWCTSTVQDEEKAQYWHQRTDQDGRLWFNKMSAVKADRFIRALSCPYPGAWAWYETKIVRIYSAEIPEFILKGSPGRICYIEGKGPYVICTDRAILISDYEVVDDRKQHLQNGKVIN